MRDSAAEYQSLRGLMRQTGRNNPTALLVAQALREELTERQQQMVELYYIRQYTMRDIAKMLGVNPSTVSRTLKAAREKLRRCLKYSRRSFMEEED